MASSGSAADWPPSCRVAALRARAGMLRSTREFFAERGVLEVQTPVLGAASVTDPAIDSMREGETGRYLQTSPEYHMKRLLAAGAPSIYQIGPVFRAGEHGRWHNPEFTMLEWYRLDFDAPRLMEEVSNLVDALLGPGVYQRRTVADLLAQRFGVDITEANDEALLAAARGLGLGPDPAVDEALDLLLADALASHRDRRVFITEFPPEHAALARLGANGTADRFELVVDGIEVANGYHELADADELEARMAAHIGRRRERQRPAVGADRRLLAAQAHGLPNCAGVAVGFDRLVALYLGVDSVADAIAFDWQRA